MAKKYAAVVFTAVDRLVDNRMAGYWLPEAAYPWLALADTGLEVVGISTTAVPPRPGGVDRTDRVQRRFLESPQVQQALADTRRAEFHHPEDCAAVVFAGGPGALFDFPGDTALGAFADAVLRHGGVVAACGYGVAGLLALAAVNEQALAGRQLTATAAEEERAQELAPLLPIRLTQELAERGAVLSFGDAFRAHVVVDGSILTGQNPASAPRLAQRLVSATTGTSSAGGSVVP